MGYQSVEFIWKKDSTKVWLKLVRTVRLKLIAIYKEIHKNYTNIKCIIYKKTKDQYSDARKKITDTY